MTLIGLLLVATGVWWLLLSANLARGVLVPKRKTAGAAIGRGDPLSPEEIGLKGEGVVFALSDDLASPGFVIAGELGEEGDVGGGADEAGQNQLGVLVVHGFCDSRYGALKWAKKVAPWAHHVVVYDQRGHGDAGGKTFGHGEREAEDVWCVLDQAAKQTGCQRWVLMGLSAGAGICLRALAMKARDGKDKCVATSETKLSESKLSSVTLPLPLPLPLPGAGAGARVVGLVAEGGYRYWDQPLVPVLEVRGYPVRPTLWLGQFFLRGFGLPLRDFDRVQWAKQCPVPVLWLHGKADSLCGFEFGRQVYEAVPKAMQKGWVTFEQGDHLNLFEVDADLYAQALKQFFESDLNEYVQ